VCGKEGCEETTVGQGVWKAWDCEREQVAEVCLESGDCERDWVGIVIECR